MSKVDAVASLIRQEQELKIIQQETKNMMQRGIFLAVVLIAFTIYMAPKK